MADIIVYTGEGVENMEPGDSCARSRQPDESTLDKKVWKSLNLTSAKNIRQHCGGQDCVGEGGAGKVVAGGGDGAAQHHCSDGQPGHGDDHLQVGKLY